MAANPTRSDLLFQLPDPPQGSRWVRVIDTARASPHDIEPEGQEPSMGDDGEIGVSAHSIVVLRSRDQRS
jgi:glycogen operon protein